MLNTDFSLSVRKTEILYILSEGPAIYNRIVWEAEHGLNITRLQKVARKIHANYINYRKMIFYQEVSQELLDLSLEFSHLYLS